MNESMRIAIVGYGKMGQMVERVALARGHRIVARFDIDNNQHANGLTRDSLADVDVAVEFSTPQVSLENVRRLIELRVPTVVGTTGWYEHLDEIRESVRANNATLVYSANFSIGMNLFFRLSREAGRLFSRYSEYDPWLIEHHHKFKKDAPSGTAIVIENLLRESYAELTPVPASIRGGHVPGTHEVGFDSEADTITLTHTARSREGFAVGAVLAAERVALTTGFFEFSEILFDHEEER
ncbi:MAG: dihydrodipicolinate reductase C-terminal domain-containing protein [Acidobacteriota bacterium]